MVPPVSPNPQIYFAHRLLRARDWQDRPEFDQLCQWWRDSEAGICALVGIGGAGKTAIAERFLRVLPEVLPESPDIPKDNTLPTPQGLFVFSFYKDNEDALHATAHSYPRQLTVRFYNPLHVNDIACVMAIF